MLSSEFKPSNFRIYRRVTKNRIIVVEDVLRFNKVRINLVEYEPGKGIEKQVGHYIDREIAALLCHDLLNRSNTDALVWWNGYEEYKGTKTREGYEARTFKIEIAETRNPIRITIWNGPGEPVGSDGAIKPARGRTSEGQSVTVLLPWTAARAMALALLMHLQAWTTMTYYQRVQNGTYQPDEEQLELDPEA